MRGTQVMVLPLNVSPPWSSFIPVAGGKVTWIGVAPKMPFVGTERGIITASKATAQLDSPVV